jgi:hypothetical protein
MRGQDEEEESRRLLLLTEGDGLRHAREGRHDFTQSRHPAMGYRGLVSDDRCTEPLTVEEQIDKIQGPLHGAGPLQLFGHVDQDFFAGVDRDVEKNAFGFQQ